MKILMMLSNPYMVDYRVSRESTSLVEAGHEVCVIEWDRKKDYKPQDTIDSVSLVRIHNKGLLKALPHDLLRNPLWWRAAYNMGIALYKKGFTFDAVHCHNLDTLVAGVLLKKKFGIKLVYDAHEIFGYMIARDMPPVIVRIALYMEKRLLPYVDHIITVNEPLQEYFRSISTKPITIIMNSKDLVSTDYIPPKNEVFTVCYIGVIHSSRMFPELVDVIGTIEKINFVIAGKKENLYEEVKKRCESYPNINFLGPIPYSDVIPKTLMSDAVLCMISPKDPNNKLGLANKQFEAMVCGRPIICTKGTYAGKLIEELDCGLVVDYTKESLKEAIITLRDNPKLCRDFGKRALQAALTQYNWGKDKEKLINLYKTLLTDNTKT